MELTSTLETEKHVNKEMGDKLSDSVVELEETKEMVRKYCVTCDLIV